MAEFAVNKLSKNRMPKVVVIGGGTGVSVLLNKLKTFDLDITAIIAVADDGGSSGKLRQITQSIPPGDIRNVICSLSTWPDKYIDILQYRFKEGNDILSGHPIGNLLISGLAEMEGNYTAAIEILSEMMDIQGRVLPSSEVPLTLCANFSDGTEIEGESIITSQGKNIERVHIKATNQNDVVTPGPGVCEAIADADVIVFGPGSLFTSILPNLLIEEVGQAVLKSEARKIYICNIMTQKGETESFTDADHVRALHEHLGQKFIDTVFVNNEKIPEEYVNLPSQDENLLQVKHDFKGLLEQVPSVISDRFLKLNEKGIYHDGEKIGKEINNYAFSHQRGIRMNF
ncbi:MAG: uridine diphosphate-N-acetylglucosamine-binding protein YvcK [Atopococcus tabaci]|uniref:Putative gluconeogenesis factor n=1 Tax=Atopococcus tabaci TaxID=269774 RepID=A0AA43UCD3_9LACT|nr:uridine diphosphate-N-acetylglucosamine-binding protein YvcK [Atopococcus tabaci]